MTDLSRILLATDLDGTFFGAGGTLLERNLRAVDDFKAAGGRFTVATGRIHRDILRVIPGAATLFNAPAILANGACLYDFSAERILFEQRMEPALVRAVVRSVGQYARAHGEEVGVRVSAAEGIFPDPESRNPYIRKDMQSAACSGAALTVSPDGEQMEKLHLYKIVVRGEADAIARVRPLVEAEFGTALTYTSSHPRFFEMNAAGCDKGHGLRRLAGWYRGTLGYEPVTVAAGNYENDLSMLRAADIAGCPSDAQELVKPTCRFILCPFQEGSIADLIGRLRAMPA